MGEHHSVKKVQYKADKTRVLIGLDDVYSITIKARKL